MSNVQSPVQGDHFGSSRAYGLEKLGSFAWHASGFGEDFLVRFKCMRPRKNGEAYCLFMRRVVLLVCFMVVVLVTVIVLVVVLVFVSERCT